MACISVNAFQLLCHTNSPVLYTVALLYDTLENMNSTVSGWGCHVFIKENTGKLFAIDNLQVMILDQSVGAVGQSQLVATCSLLHCVVLESPTRGKDIHQCKSLRSLHLGFHGQ
jgi:hypothetical protein